MAEFINTVDILGDDVVLDSLIERTITEFKDNRLTHPRTYAFASCAALKTVDLPSVKSLSHATFLDCGCLTALILRGETMCVNSNRDNLSGTPIEPGTGYVYVPRALLDGYKSATNWSTYADQFRALEDYTVDGTTTGELDESKI